MKQYFSTIIVAIVTVSVMFAALILGDLLEPKYIFLAIIVSVLFPAFVLAVQFFDTYRKAKLIRDDFPQETILLSKPATIYMDYQEVHLFLTNKQLHILNPNQNNHIDSYPFEDILDFEVTDFIIIYLKNEDELLLLLTFNQSKVNNILGMNVQKQPVKRSIVIP